MQARWLLFLFAVLQYGASAQGPGSNTINAYIEQSRLYMESQPDTAVDYCNRGMKIAEASNDLKGQALLLVQLGRINSLHHHTDLARRFTNEALSIFRNLRYQQGIAMAYDELGLLDGENNNSKASAADFDRSLKFYESTRDSAGIAATYHIQGSVLEEKGETENALTYYLRSLVQYERHTQKPADYFILLEKISRLYAKKGDRMAALHYLQEGVQNSSASAFRDTEMNLLEDEAGLEEAAGDNASALNFYKQELNLAKNTGNLERQARALAGIAAVLGKDSLGRSLAYLKEALDIANSLRHPQLRAVIYEALAGVYKQQKNYKEAMLILAEHNRLLDSLLTANTDRDIAALDSSYVIESAREKMNKLQVVNNRERKELDVGIAAILIIVAALVLLALYLRKIKRLNHRLNKSNQMRDTLFSIIGHDLKGPAGNTVELLGLIEAGELPEELQRQMLAELKTQTKASYDLLNDLFAWGKAQLHGVEVKPELFAIHPVVEKNISLLAQQAAFKNITLADNTDAGFQVYADQHHVDFVIRNLLSNAIKFTYEKGAVIIDTTRNAGFITCAVRDNGIGISQEKQQAFLKTSLPVSFGTKGEKGSGLGLLLIKEFVQANKGRIWLESEEGKGTTFFFSLPAMS